MSCAARAAGGERTVCLLVPSSGAAPCAGQGPVVPFTTEQHQQTLVLMLVLLGFKPQQNLFLLLLLPGALFPQLRLDGVVHLNQGKRHADRVFTGT